MVTIIVGSTGMLGSDIRKVFSEGYNLKNPDRKDMDITSWDRVIAVHQKAKPKLVINCAAITDVSGCDSNKYLTRKTNIEGPRNLAQCSARYESRLVHFSSDYVFDGQKTAPQPYFEDDNLNPLTFYGKCKMESELAVRDNSPNYIIVRTGWLYGLNGHGFLKKVLSRALTNPDQVINVPNDHFGSPTWTYKLALQVKSLVESDRRGTYHATAEGYCSQFAFIKFVFDKLGIKAIVEPCKLRDINADIRIPYNCILENSMLKKRGLNIMHDWREDLDEFLEKYGDELLRSAQG